METFEEYLERKKINSSAFKTAKEELWQEWAQLFQQMHPNSFTNQKLFLINQVRRQFPLELTKSS